MKIFEKQKAKTYKKNKRELIYFSVSDLYCNYL